MKELDKAIKLAKEMAEEYKFKSNPNRKYPCFDSEEKRIKCQKRGEQYEQLAEWLKDYKRLRMVTSQPKIGYWIHHKETFDHAEHWECSNCHRNTMTYPFIVQGNDYNAMFYCPKCGVKMPECEVEEV